MEKMEKENLILLLNLLTLLPRHVASTTGLHATTIHHVFVAKQGDLILLETLKADVAAHFPSSSSLSLSPFSPSPTESAPPSPNRLHFPPPLPPLAGQVAE
jgi:hypothetical protein